MSRPPPERDVILYGLCRTSNSSLYLNHRFPRLLSSLAGRNVGLVTSTGRAVQFLWLSSSSLLLLLFKMLFSLIYPVHRVDILRSVLNTVCFLSTPTFQLSEVFCCCCFVFFIQSTTCDNPRSTVLILQHPLSFLHPCV